MLRHIKAKQFDTDLHRSPSKVKSSKNSKILVLIKAYNVTVIEISDIFCNNFLHFGYNKTKQSQMKLIEKSKYFVIVEH